ncbi:MAG: biliverdin-producing heme oxygenase [Ginsengibacter sp.]
MLSEELKLKTKQHHQQLEVKIIGAIKSIQHKNDYVQLLQLFAGFFGALEVSIDQIMDLKFLPDYALRRKATALHSDLILLSASLPIKLESQNLPTIENSLQALGALYVMEGSTLGGQVIAKMILNKLPEEKAFSFFKSYGEKTNEMWNFFKATIDAIDLTKDEMDIVIESANETFHKFSLYVDFVNAD